MTARGVHFALTEDETAGYLGCENDEAREEFVTEEIEEQLFTKAPERVAETDKAWDAIHRALNGGDLDPDVGTYPASHVILGGTLAITDVYYMSLKTPQQVNDVAEFLASITQEVLRQGYQEVDPKKYGPNFSDKDFEYTWYWFERLRTFYSRAADNKHHVVFTVAL